MNLQAEERRRVEGALPSHFPTYLPEEHETEGTKENVGVVGNSEEKNMAELDMFVIRNPVSPLSGISCVYFPCEQQKM